MYIYSFHGANYAASDDLFTRTRWPNM